MDLHLLPKIRDGWSYLYVEHCKVEQEAKGIAIYDTNGKAPVPCATLSLLMLGPGTSVTHAAIRALADNGCLVVWSGEEGVRFYAQGMGETRSASRLLRQSWLVSDPVRRLAVVRRMYERRFPEPLDPALTLYPTPSPAHCPECIFVAPCLTMTEGGDPTLDLASRFRQGRDAPSYEARLGAGGGGGRYVPIPPPPDV